VKVLIVEDDEAIKKLLALRVREAGHAVIAVDDAETALSVVAERGCPDVAVLDIGLPGMNGMRLLSVLREQVGKPDLPAIFVSARVTPADVELGRSLGATYLTKPVVAHALLNAIRNAGAPARAER
jgi:DNA-binding response OmpR family regulator